MKIDPTERNFYLMKEVGLCTRGGTVMGGAYHCDDCAATFQTLPELLAHGSKYRNFSEWEDFGLLWTWARSKSWWRECYHTMFEQERENGCESYSVDILEDYITPNKFADRIYLFLTKYMRVPAKEKGWKP